MAKKGKYYVVWAGIEPGVYDNWDDCAEQVQTYPGAKFKSFPSYESAVKAFREGSDDKASLVNLLRQQPQTVFNYSAFPEVDSQAIAVDAACAGNPGPMEYRGVSLSTGRQLFHLGPLPGGTNNIGEYLAIVHALALCEKQGELNRTIYSDSRIAQGWVRNRRCNTHIIPGAENAKVRELIARADRWLQTHELTNPIRKWKTEIWGEIPADFNRK
ncbi:MAG: ribonuclease H family protein [Prevotella sp.]|nr:ribonuclease H family protein [Prevotella sp.]MCM1075146.1 ribonuclease H family protein [Ruminococcus sp.]